MSILRVRVFLVSCISLWKFLFFTNIFMEASIYCHIRVVLLQNCVCASVALYF